MGTSPLEYVMPDTWNVETLREYLLALIAANDVKYTGLFDESKNAVREAFLAQQTAMQTALTAQKLAVDTALIAQKLAVDKAEIAADKRFDSVNEFRALVADQQRTYIPRAEVALLIETLTDKVDTCIRSIETVKAEKNGGKELFAYIVGGVGIIGLVASIIISIFK